MALTAQLVRDDRRADRETLDVDGTLRGIENTPIDIVVEDLSATGFRIRTDAGLNLDETVSIGIAGIGRRQARVVRQTADGFGCAFVQPIDPSLVAAPLTAQPIVTGDFGAQLDPAAVRDWSALNPPHVAPFSRGRRMLVVGGLGVVSWLAVLGVLSLL